MELRTENDTRSFLKSTTLYKGFPIRQKYYGAVEKRDYIDNKKSQRRSGITFSESIVY